MHIKSKRDSFQITDTMRLKVKEWEKIFHSNTNNQAELEWLYRWSPAYDGST